MIKLRFIFLLKKSVLNKLRYFSHGLNPTTLASSYFGGACRPLKKLPRKVEVKRKRYTLFKLLPNGKCKHIFSHDYDKRDWAVMLWSHIDRWFEEEREIEAKLKASLVQVSSSPELSKDTAVLGGELGAKMGDAVKDIADCDGIIIATNEEMKIFPLYLG